MHAIFSYFPPEKEERVERGGEVIVSRHLAPKTLAKFSDILLNLNLHVGKGFSSSSRLLRGIATGSKLPFPWHLLTAFIIQAEEQGFLFAFHNRRGTGDLYGMTRSTWAALVSGD
jgi:hypothetical protein